MVAVRVVKAGGVVGVVVVTAVLVRVVVRGVVVRAGGNES